MRYSWCILYQSGIVAVTEFSLKIENSFFFLVIKKERVVPEIAFNKFRPRQAMIFFRFFLQEKSQNLFRLKFTFSRFDC